MPTENLLSVIERYSDEDRAREALEKIRWPDGVACPRCGDTAVSELRDYDKWDCNGCRYQFTVTAGTVMHRSHLPLFKWFLAVYLICESKKGMSANQLKRTLGVSYKTAWFLCHRIREAMEGGNLDGPTLFGVIEVHQTWLDHPDNNRKKRSGKLKGRGPQVYIAGAIQRGGKVRLQQIPDLKGPTLKAFIHQHVKDEAHAIYTDNLKSYVGIPTDKTRHGVASKEHAWVIGDVHTNSIDNVWSLLKRSVVESFHKVSVKHLKRYLEELEWRFNNRNNPHIFRDTMRRILETDPLEYEKLTA